MLPRLAALAVSSVLVSFSAAGVARADDASSQVRGHEVRDARAEVDATLAQMRATSLRVRDQLRATRKRGTKAEVTCVDQALSRADVALRRAREASDEMLAAYGRADVETARAARHRLVEIKNAQRLAANEGAWCAPAAAPIAASGTTTVKVDIDPKIPPAP